MGESRKNEDRRIGSSNASYRTKVSNLLSPIDSDPLSRLIGFLPQLPTDSRSEMHHPSRTFDPYRDRIFCTMRVSFLAFIFNCIHSDRSMRWVVFWLLVVSLAENLAAIDYPYPPYNEGRMEPQTTGWPLTPEERSYVVNQPEHDRRPGREANKHLPQLWPVVPSAGYFGGDSWLKLHEAHVETVRANAGAVDVLLVGDSITIQWGESWRTHFPDLKSVNIGIGGDKTQNILWRLDHGGVEGIQPEAVVLMIGNNNMFFTPETGIDAVAQGIEWCAKNLREKFPTSRIIVAKILPAHEPGNRFYDDIRKTNTALDALHLDADPQMRVLDLTVDFTHADGTLKQELFTVDGIHLSPAGYAVYAARLRPYL
jgi:platelet-activating factor acetylhydrolase IB subunit beta/gamma